MLYLLLGKFGQLGWELRRTLACLGTVVALDYPEIDLTNADQTRWALRTTRPQVIINATAYTAVDQAEEEIEKAMALNGTAPGVLAEEALSLGAALIHFSTDYVFDGRKGGLYTEADPAKPLNIYGKSKLAGEEAISALGGPHLILRTSWVYSTRRESFVSKVLGWARQHDSLRIVSDQVGNPTSARQLAEITALLLARAGKAPAGYLAEHRGLYHLAGSGHASRLEWARAILKHDPHKEEQRAVEIAPARTNEFPTPAQRPLFSALNCDRFTQTFGLQLPPWEQALELDMSA